MPRAAHWVSLLALLALFVLVGAWAFTVARDGWPVPALLALPLVAPLPGMLRGASGAYLLAALLSLLYLFHGLITLVTDPSWRGLGSLEALLALLLLVAASLSARWARPPA